MEKRKSEGNTRLIIVITLLGVSGLILNSSMELLYKSFLQISLEKLGISPTQILFGLVGSGFCLLLLLSIFYVFFELNVYRNLIKYRNLNGYFVLADFTFNLLLNFILLIPLFSFLFTLFFELFVEKYELFFFDTIYFLDKWREWIIFIVFVICAIIIGVLYKFPSIRNFVLKFHKNKRRFDNSYINFVSDNEIYNFADRIGLNSRYNKFNLYASLFFIWLAILFPFTILNTINKIVDTSIDITFDNEIIINFKGRTDDFMPEKITIKNCDLNSNCNTKEFTNSDFIISKAEITSIQGGKKSQKLNDSLVKKTLIVRTSELNLSERNEGYLLIDYEYNRFETDEKLKIYNSYYYKDNNLTFHIESFDAEL